MLQEKINNDLKHAMKDKNVEKLSVLRMLISALNNEAISLKKKEEGLSNEEELKVLKQQVKHRKDSIEQYQSGGRADLAEREKSELEILQRYMPKEMSEEEITKIVAEVISEISEIVPLQFGQVMGKVMERLKGKADGGTVSKVVREVMDRKK